MFFFWEGIFWAYSPRADLIWARKADLRGVVEDYVLFDCPGQVELFTHHESLRNIFFRIQRLGYRVRFSLSPLEVVESNLLLTSFGGIASCATSDGLVRTHSSLVVYLDATPIASRHASDGSTSSQCSYKDR